MQIDVVSTLDGSSQPSLYYPARGEKRPLIVGLHTWSFDRYNQIDNLLPVAQKYDFNLLLPEFRGPNLKTNPICTEACASPLAVRDTLDAIEYVCRDGSVDTDSIFLIGLSGGGHMALMVAAHAPELFRAVASYVPITDLAAWCDENENYRPHVLACCTDRAEMLRRSPISYLDSIARANLKIFHGKFDPVVPVSHSIRLYSAIMERHPTSRVFLDIFDGGHEIDMNTAVYWLLSQYEKKELSVVTG